MYGLKQAPRAWNSKIDAYFQEYGFRRSPSETSLYIKQEKEGNILIVCLYVDDLIYTGTNPISVEKFKQSMMNQFEMTDLGLMKYFLRIQVQQSKGKIFISQEKYVDDLLKKYRMVNCNPTSTPLVINKKLKLEDDNPKVNVHMYHSLVRSLMYLTHTRPDLAYPCSLIARFQVAPSTLHFAAAKRTLRYLNGITSCGIKYVKEEKSKLNDDNTTSTKPNTKKKVLRKVSDIQDEEEAKQKEDQEIIQMPRNSKSKITNVYITPKSKKVPEMLVTILRANQLRETIDMNQVNLLHLDKWAQIIEVLPKSGKHVLNLKALLQQKWLAYQRKREALQGRLEDVFRPPPGIAGEPGTVIEHPQLGVFYHNYHGDLMFQRASEFHRLSDEDLFGFTGILKPCSLGLKFHDPIIIELKKRAEQRRQEELKKGAGTSKKK